MKYSNMVYHTPCLCLRPQYCMHFCSFLTLFHSCWRLSDLHSWFICLLSVSGPPHPLLATEPKLEANPLIIHICLQNPKMLLMWYLLHVSGIPSSFQATRTKLEILLNSRIEHLEWLAISSYTSSLTCKVISYTWEYMRSMSLNWLTSALHAGLQIALHSGVSSQRRLQTLWSYTLELVQVGACLKELLICENMASCTFQIRVSSVCVWDKFFFTNTWTYSCDENILYPWLD